MAVLSDLYSFVLNTFIFNKLLFLTTESFWVHYYGVYYSYSTSYTFVFTLKLVLCLSFLIFIRGGVPRYRYDFLTKIGWIKFLGYVITMFMITLLFATLI